MTDDDKKNVVELVKDSTVFDGKEFLDSVMEQYEIRDAVLIFYNGDDELLYSTNVPNPAEVNFMMDNAKISLLAGDGSEYIE